MAVRTFGDIRLEDGYWLIENTEPHVAIKLKGVFNKLPKTAKSFRFIDSPENCNDLLWFMERYPLRVSEQDLKKLKSQRENHIKDINDLEAILLPEYVPRSVQLKNGYEGRDYQIKGKEVFLKCKRLLIGDSIGLGKTMIAILSMLHQETLPCIVVVQTHLTLQWKSEIYKFTNLSVHIIKGTKPYALPPADVYIIKYSCLAGWVDVFYKSTFRSAVFDETQELRREKSWKYKAAKALSEHVQYCLGLSASPIYNYGDEIFNVMDVIKDNSLGDRSAFLNEWVNGWGSRIVTDPKALGTYLRENFLMLRRTRQEVGRELPPINKIIHTVEYDEGEVKKADEIARQLAIKVTSGSFIERGAAARDLDIFVRHSTGVAKARGIAEYCKILLGNKEPIVLAAWHRDVYDILLEELKEYKPVMFTGSESPAQKEKAKQAFLNGETDCFIISLRSGIGLDGLQSRCNTVVIGELDWSPQVHNQLIGRVDRDGQQEQVTAIFLVSDCGSDPLIIDMLGLKASQSHGIINPLETEIQQQYTDETRIKLLAQRYLDKKHHVQTELFQN
ncbi:MAG: DEAD/DEAH box helicase [Candidatus Nanoarchaeia archaeon]|nr:DEAD/DEAH box helicase [Candidatus Nanoarchaeia archaeon]